MKDNLVIMLCHNPWEWSADYANQTARQLRKDNSVICVLFGDAKSIKEMLIGRDRHVFWRRISARLHIFIPLYIIPFRRFRAVVWINNWINTVLLMLWLQTRGFYRLAGSRYVWIFHPGYGRLLRVFGKTYSSVYDCVDYFGGSSTDTSKELMHEENELIRSSTYFFVNSRALFRLHGPIREAVVVPQGFGFREFSKARRPAHIHIPHDKPVIGYIGGINYRLDYHLLCTFAKKNPEYYFMFVGPIQSLNESHFYQNVQPQIRSLFQNRNCLYYPQQPKETMISIIQQFDICMIPYDVRFDFNKYCYPMKLFEYFYMGKPVISTPIEELKRFPKYVKIGNTEKEWEEHVTSILFCPWSKLNQKEQRRLAIENSWERKISHITSLIK